MNSDPCPESILQESTASSAELLGGPPDQPPSSGAASTVRPALDSFATVNPFAKTHPVDPPSTVIPAGAAPPEADPYATAAPVRRAGARPTPFSALAPAGYAILDELGRGGMGVVYKARQEGLNRVVALKMILGGAHASAEERRRFLAEAEAIAAIRHPGIVQVYEFGTHQGLPYFALEFCAGGSLAARLAAGPLPPREAARTVAEIAGAVQAAHERGIVHRDLKPGNVLLGEDGQPRVTDFGLARRVEDQSGLTQTGMVLGTPSYMPPEQAGGVKDLGPAADIYALGAILYDCLSGRPPFQAATSHETLHQVINQEPVAPRRLNPGVPADLETICLKCLDKEPGRRYPSARDLADDLRAFLEHRPIKARPSTLWERSRKWARRHPTASALAGVSLVVTLALLALGWAFTLRLTQLNTALGAANGALETSNTELKDREVKLTLAKGEVEEKARALEASLGREKEERRKAEEQERQTARREREAQENFLQAQKGLERLINLAQRRLRHEPRLAEARREILRDALDMSRQLTASAQAGNPPLGDSPAFRLRTALAYRLTGELQDLLGQPKESVESYRKSASLLRDLLEGAEDSRKQGEYRAELAEVYINLWAVLEALDPDQAEEVLDEALRLLGSLSSESGQGSALVRDHAALLGNRAIHYQRRGQSRQAEETYCAAVELCRRLPDSPDAWRERSRIEVNWGTLLAQQGRPRQALPAVEEAADRLEKMVHLAQDDTLSAVELGRALNIQGGLLRSLGRGQEAQQVHQRGIALFRELRRTHPRIPDYDRLLGQALVMLGRDLAQQPEEARPVLLEARTLLGQLAADHPEVKDYRLELARACTLLGLVELGAGRAEEAREPLAESRRLLHSFPSAEDHEACEHNLALCLDALARRADRAKAWTRAEPLLEELADVRRARLARRADPPARRNDLAGWLSSGEDFVAELLARADLAGTLLAQARVLSLLGQPQRAAAVVEELAGLVPPSWERYPEMLRVLARALALAARQDGPGPLAGTLTQQLGQQMLDLLACAAESGRPGLAGLLVGPELDVLRTRPEFRPAFRRSADRLAPGLALELSVPRR